MIHIDFGLFWLCAIRGSGSVRVMHEFLLNRSEQKLDNKEADFVTKCSLKPIIVYLVSYFIVRSFRGKMSGTIDPGSKVPRGSSPKVQACQKVPAGGERV